MCVVIMSEGVDGVEADVTYHSVQDLRIAPFRAHREQVSIGVRRRTREGMMR